MFWRFMEKDWVMKKIIIVGADPGGLAVAMLLAHKGYEVQVYEKQL